MKRVFVWSLGFIVVIVIYYLTLGSDKINHTLKIQLHKELSQLQKAGFSVTTQKSQKKNEYFILGIEESQKIANYLAQKELDLSVQEIEALKGLEIALEVKYLRTCFKVILYPLALPSDFKTSMKSKTQKSRLVQIEKFISQKVFVLTLDIPHTMQSFRGYIKDIDQTLYDESNLSLVLQGFNFKGELNLERLSHITQDFDKFSLRINEEMSLSLHGLKSLYEVTGTSDYDHIIEYEIEKIVLQGETNESSTLKSLSLHHHSNVKKGIGTEEFDAKIEKLILKERHTQDEIDKLHFEMKIKNLDVTAFSKLQNMNTFDEKILIEALQQLISKSIHFEITNFSAETLTLKNQKVEGFVLNTSIDVNQSLNIAQLQNNPFLALENINASLNLTLSEELLSFIAQKPQAMMPLMMFPPATLKKKKNYSFILKEGIITLNGKAMF